MSQIKYDFTKNTLFSSISEFSSVFLYVFAILVARTLGPSDYGIFIFSISFGTIYALFVRFGFLSYLSREIPLNIDNGMEMFGNVLSAQLWLALFSILLTIPTFLLLPKPADEKVIIFIMVAAMLFHAFKWTIRGALRGFDLFYLDSIIVIDERLMLLFIAICAILGSWSLLKIATAFLLLRITDFAISLTIAFRKMGRPTLSLNMKIFKEIIMLSWPFAAMTLLFVIYNYCDTIMISFMRTDAEVGLYNIAYQVFEGSQLFPGSIAGGLLPLLTINYVSNIEYANQLLNFSITIMFYMAFPLAIFVSTYAGTIVLMLYGESYMGAVPALKLIIWSVIVFFPSVIARAAFYAAQKEKTYAVIFALSVLFNIVLNIPMIHYYGFIGACISTIFTEVGVCIILLKYLKQMAYKFKLLDNMQKPFLVNLFLWIPLYFARQNNVHILLAGVSFACLYFSIIYYLKLITIEDFRKLKNASV